MELPKQHLSIEHLSSAKPDDWEGMALNVPQRKWVYQVKTVNMTCRIKIELCRLPEARSPPAMWTKLSSEEIICR
jgi:hypothetical protein